MTCVILTHILLFQTEVYVDVDLWEETVGNQCLTEISGSATATCPGSPCSTMTISSDGKSQKILTSVFFLEFNVCYKNSTNVYSLGISSRSRIDQGCPNTFCGIFLSL